MKVLVIGSGGREHALVWKIAQSPLVTKIYCAPGNPGIGKIAENISIKATDIDGLLKFFIQPQRRGKAAVPLSPKVDRLIETTDFAAMGDM